MTHNKEKTAMSPPMLSDGGGGLPGNLDGFCPFCPFRPGRWQFLTAVVAVGFWFLLTMPVLSAGEPSADEILQAVDRNLHPESFESFFRITNHLPNGRQRTITLYSAMKGKDRAVVLIISPQIMRGRALLRIGNEVWMHRPGEVETRPGDLRRSLVGGVFNNADILTVNYHSDYKAAILRKDDDSYILRLTPRNPQLPFAKLVLRVHRKSLIPQTLSQYTAGGALIKTIQFKNPQKQGLTRVRPSRLETESSLNHRYRAVLELGRLNERVLPDDVFTRAFLPRVGTLLK